MMLVRLVVSRVVPDPIKQTPDNRLVRCAQQVGFRLGEPIRVLSVQQGDLQVGTNRSVLSVKQGNIHQRLVLHLPRRVHLVQQGNFRQRLVLDLPTRVQLVEENHRRIAHTMTSRKDNKTL